MTSGPPETLFVCSAGASGTAADREECSPAQQLYVLDPPAASACATWHHPSGPLISPKAHQGTQDFINVLGAIFLALHLLIVSQLFITIIVLQPLAVT